MAYDHRLADVERENEALRDALRGVLDHYHAPCSGCWDALKFAAEVTGYIGDKRLAEAVHNE